MWALSVILANWNTSRGIVVPSMFLLFSWNFLDTPSLKLHFWGVNYASKLFLKAIWEAVTVILAAGGGVVAGGGTAHPQVFAHNNIIIIIIQKNTKMFSHEAPWLSVKPDVFLSLLQPHMTNRKTVRYTVPSSDWHDTSAHPDAFWSSASAWFMQHIYPTEHLAYIN